MKLLTKVISTTSFILISQYFHVATNNVDQAFAHCNLRTSASHCASHADPSNVIKTPIPLPGTEDFKREIDNCINHGGCDLIPAEEAWGELGRRIYLAGESAIAASNIRLPEKKLDTFQKQRLRPFFGGLVDLIRVKYGAKTLDNWRIANQRISIPSDGQTFCNKIYITQRHRDNDFSLLKLMAHEITHSLQCQRFGGASNFGYHYFKGYKKANQNYRNNELEKEAFNFADSIDWRILKPEINIVNALNRCLDNRRSDISNNGGKVQIWKCNNEQQQKWTLVNQTIRNGAGLCLDTHAPDMNTNGGRVQVWKCNGSRQQKWTLVD